MESVKKRKGFRNDTDLTVSDLKLLCEEFKEIIKQTLNKEFPDDPKAQLWAA